MRISVDTPWVYSPATGVLGRRDVGIPFPTVRVAVSATGFHQAPAAMKDAWVQVTPSEYPWEREGLAFLKERLPDHEPFRAWANFEFLVDGTVSELDVLVVARKGIFLVELKGWPGRITGDAGTWQWTPPNAVVSHPGFGGDLETRISVLERGTTSDATTQEVLRRAA